jgi:UDP-glucose 4-epimerase
MKVVVFGGSGFLGSHVCDKLSDAGYKVVIFDCKESSFKRPEQEMIVGDILDEKIVKKAVKDCKIVYNFSGIADIDKASKNPLESVKTNILGNSIIIEACRKTEIKRFVYASSLYVYSKTGSFYRSTKQSCESIIESYNEVYGLPYTILRYGSLYGPRADEGNFIAEIIKQAITEGKIVRAGDGGEIREYIHVYDAAKGSVEILSDGYINQYVIVTGNQQMKVRDLMYMIREMLDNKIEIEFANPVESYHYEITPYTFTPKLAKRLVSNTYFDLGQGILKLMQSVYKDNNPFPVYDGIVVEEK